MKLKNKLLVFMNNHLFLFAMIRLFQQRKNKEYLRMASLSNWQVIYKRENRSLKLDKKRTFYIVKYDWRTNGFFAIMRKCLDGCAFADAMGWTPHIQIEGSIFNVPGGYQGIDNMFEYYYNPVTDITLTEIEKEENYIIANSAHSMNIYNQFTFEKKDFDSREYNVNEELLMYLGGIVKKYFVLKPRIQKEIFDEITKVIPETKVLGVHFRGSDFRTGRTGHPIQCDVGQYFDVIDKALNYGFQNIFLATDDQNVIDQFYNRYGNKICIFKDVERSSTECGVHFQKHDREYDQFYLGREVLRDMLALARCDGLIAGISQVSLFARIQKYSYGEKYDYQYIIDNGFNKRNSVKAKKYYNRLYKGLKVLK